MNGGPLSTLADTDIRTGPAEVPIPGPDLDSRGATTSPAASEQSGEAVMKTRPLGVGVFRPLAGAPEGGQEG